MSTPSTSRSSTLRHHWSSPQSNIAPNPRRSPDQLAIKTETGIEESTRPLHSNALPRAIAEWTTSRPLICRLTSVSRSVAESVPSLNRIQSAAFSHGSATAVDLAPESSDNPAVQARIACINCASSFNASHRSDGTSLRSSAACSCVIIRLTRSSPGSRSN